MVKYDDAALDGVFEALSDPTRRAIVARLGRDEFSIGELAEPFGMSLVAVSKHIRKLEKVSLVRRRISGRTHYCRLDPTGLRQAHLWLGAYQAFWNARLDALESVLADRKKRIR